jgi:hypothetical protein
MPQTKKPGQQGFVPQGWRDQNTGETTFARLSELLGEDHAKAWHELVDAALDHGLTETSKLRDPHDQTERSARAALNHLKELLGFVVEQLRMMLSGKGVYAKEQISPSYVQGFIKFGHMQLAAVNELSKLLNDYLTEKHPAPDVARPFRS